MMGLDPAFQQIKLADFTGQNQGIILGNNIVRAGDRLDLGALECSGADQQHIDTEIGPGLQAP